MQMFPSLSAQETFVADAYLALWMQENVIESIQKHSCFPDTNNFFPKQIFPSLATLEEAMFPQHPSLARLFIN